MEITLSRLIIGIILIFGGIFFIILSIFTLIFLLIYGIPLLILGLFILLNKHEDKIETRKDLKERKYHQ